MEENINANKDSSELPNFDGISSPLENGKEETKGNKILSLKLIIIISVIILSIILLIILIVVLVNLDECKSGYFYQKMINLIAKNA